MELLRQDKNSTMDMAKKFHFGYSGMTMRWYERAKQVMLKRGIKNVDLEKRLGDSQANISRFLTGVRGQDSIITATRFAKALGIHPCELIFGEEGIPTKVIHPPDLTVQSVPRFQTFSESFARQQYIPIRLLGGAAAAGPPSEVQESEIDSWVLIYASREWMPHDPENYTCVKVAGQSMHPILNDGDIVAIDHAERNPVDLDKKMAVFRVDGGVTIKWLRHLPDKGLVVGVPENKDELDNVVTLKGEEIDEGIVGRVAWWWAKR